ncbi:hypothetical protein N8500_04760 [Candidatus Puniceispirillum sp.]|nr:hypothetical protein [Candidatus Puniceispirillum sp.]
MDRHMKPTFTEHSDVTFAKQARTDAKNLGIEFMHFDKDDKIESQHVVPLGRFISEAPLTSDEYVITRSLVAAQAAK